jgi:hypothetical protein
LQLLPSLVIVGHCFWLYGLQLPAKISELMHAQQMRAQLAASKPVLPEVTEATAEQAVASENTPHILANAGLLCPSATGMAHNCGQMSRARLDWLTSSRVSAQLDAAGYGSSAEGAVAVAVQQLQQLVAAHAAAWDSDSEETCPFEALARQLQQTGKALSTLAVPGFCNNPACIDISKTMEASLVCGHTTKCSSCCTARYCSRAYQGAQLKQHRPVCKALAATHAATRGGSS